MTKCYGCGIELQNVDSSKEGYIRDLNKDLCERCFKIKNYNDYKPVTKDNNEYLKILKEINKTNDLVLLVVDVFNISDEIKDIVKLISNDKLLVFTKRDLLPSDMYEEKILKYLDFNFIDRIIVSSKKNYHLDLLMNKINKYKHSKDVYVVGLTNAGKSTLINKIIYNYTDILKEITTSNLPSTTLNTIKIDIDSNLCLIDTPGILDNGNIINYIDSETIKKVIPNKEIKPIIYQIKVNQSFIVDEICRIDVQPNNDIVFYFSNNLNIDRI